MKRVFLKSNSLSPNFIGSWMLDSTLICDEMINYFENHTELQKSGSSGFKVDKEIKDSSDISFFNLMNGMQFNSLDNLPKEKTLYRVGVNDGVNFVVYIPEHNSIRTLGFWEYAGLGLKKYLNYKVKDQLEKLGVL